MKIKWYFLAWSVLLCLIKQEIVLLLSTDKSEIVG